MFILLSPPLACSLVVVIVRVVVTIVRVVVTVVCVASTIFVTVVIAFCHPRTCVVVLLPLTARTLIMTVLTVTVLVVLVVGTSLLLF